ncbi:MAG: restriction endonuclease subunit S [Planktothrix sp.]|uniref:restriction endonuclease subunit S n=2 Tax=Planktothrix sp. TaxID=3088171 RepID=UPI0038D44D37
MNVEGWQIKRLEEIGVIFSGSTPSTSKPSFWDGNIVWVTPNDLSQLNTPYLYNSGKKITEQGLKNCSAQILPPNSIIISSRAPIGYIAINRVECCTNQGCKSFQLRREYNPEFVYYNLHFNINKIKMLGEGTTFAEISKTALAKVEIPFLENYEEQEQIAAVLSTIDRAIEQTEAIIAKQQRIKTGLMQDLLTKGIDENGNIRSEETHEFKDSAIGRIPVEWSIKPIGNIASLQRGHDIREVDLMPGVYPVVASSGVIGFHSTGTSSSPNVVVGRKGSIGNVHYVDIDFWAHDTSLYVTNFFGNNEKYIYYLFSYLKLERFGTKSGSPSLNRNDVHPLKVPFPDVVEQGRISSMLSEFDTSMESIKCALSKLKVKKIGLMQDLLTGKVRVTPLLQTGGDRHP